MTVPLVDLQPWFEADATVRAAARRFFAQPEPDKARFAVPVGGRGWLPPGAEANGYSEGTPTPPDLKESYSVGADRPTGDADIDAVWFLPNVWPDDELREATSASLPTVSTGSGRTPTSAPAPCSTGSRAPAASRCTQGTVRGWTRHMTHKR